MGFDWGDHRKARWLKLCAAILGDEGRAKALTALLNLAPGHATDERSIPRVDLQEGWRRRVRPLLPDVRPRIVCALTNAVWETISNDVDIVSGPQADCPIALARDPIHFRVEGCSFPSILVKPHNHPSRFLRNEQIESLGRACAWLLDHT